VLFPDDSNIRHIIHTEHIIPAAGGQGQAQSLAQNGIFFSPPSRTLPCKAKSSSNRQSPVKSCFVFLNMTNRSN